MATNNILIDTKCRHHAVDQCVLSEALHQCQDGGRAFYLAAAALAVMLIVARHRGTLLSQVKRVTCHSSTCHCRADRRLHYRPPVAPQALYSTMQPLCCRRALQLAARQRGMPLSKGSQAMALRSQLTWQNTEVGAASTTGGLAAFPWREAPALPWGLRVWLKRARSR